MKKSVTILALALCLTLPNLNASNFETTTNVVTVVNPTEKVDALSMAAIKGDVEKVKMLLKNGMNVNAKSNGMLPIHYAARYNRVEVIKVLITAGSKIHRTCDKGLTPLRHAEKTNASEAAEFLIRFKYTKDN